MNIPTAGSRMLEYIILLLLALTFVGAAKKGRRKFNLRKVKVSPELPLLTLASDTALAIGFTTTGGSANPWRCMSVEATWALTDLTANDGPIEVGVAHSDYTVTQIKEYLENFASIDIGNKSTQEIATRWIRSVGTLNDVRTSLNNGMPVKTKLNWGMTIGKFINIWAYNQSTFALTTLAVLNVDGHLWVKDGR